jgi:integron-associated effector binding protein
MVIGIEARTTNAKEATAGGIIAAQWQKFFQEGILGKIPNKTGANIYALYAEYAGDRNGEYVYVIGAMVKEGTKTRAGRPIRGAYQRAGSTAHGCARSLAEALETRRRRKAEAGLQNRFRNL